MPYNDKDIYLRSQRTYALAVVFLLRLLFSNHLPLHFLLSAKIKRHMIIHVPKIGAPEESRTPDPRLKRALLYQLSYRRLLNCPVCTVSPLILRPLVTPFRHKTWSHCIDFMYPVKFAAHVLIMVERDGNDPSSCGFSDRRSDLISYRSIWRRK